MQLKELKKIPHIDKVKLHSLESNLYQLSVIIGDKEEYITTNEGRFLTSHNKLDLQALFKGKSVGSMVLCHQSAYDEMVGQPIGVGNALEVPLGNTDLA
ncbi:MULTISPECIES: DUF6482 family protein [Marinomonas]|uniref:Uncharacterized protein n=1 Tax=Marinomonas arctica TaxID=383750 RepID=A0A7H1J985_9GAMM|nr:MULTISPECIES: DUF6482 family protein [Marinomonas]QNT07051.1 hypothetical protein IBG28_05275 [Marinomonas arctica]GGN35174.1 hypothetical protein GCM10011350_32130 [Marinomonas arctica]